MEVSRDVECSFERYIKIWVIIIYQSLYLKDFIKKKKDKKGKKNNFGSNYFKFKN